MADYIKKLEIIAVREETAFGEGLVKSVTDASAARTVASPVVLTGVVQEYSIEVINDTKGVTLKPTEYTVTVDGSGVTTITFVVGTNFADNDSCTINYGVWVDADSILTLEDSTTTFDVEKIERNTMNRSYVKCPSVSGTETSGYNINTELILRDGNKLDSHLLMKSTLGVHVVGGANPYASAQTSLPSPFGSGANGADVTLTLYDALNTADIKVGIGTNNTATLLTITTDYTVVDNSNGSWTITLLDASTNFTGGESIFVWSPNSLAVSEVAGGSGSGDLYRFASPTEGHKSLTLRHYKGGSGDMVRDLFGLVPDNAELTFTGGDLARLTYSAGGVLTKTAQGTQAPLEFQGCGSTFTVKFVTFAKSGVTYKDTSDISLTFTNDVADFNGVGGSGITRKTITGKMVQGTFTLLSEDNSNLNKLQSDTKEDVYISLVNGNNDEVVIYLPSCTLVSVVDGDSDGVVNETVTVEGFNDENKQAMYLYTKKGA